MFSEIFAKVFIALLGIEKLLNAPNAKAMGVGVGLSLNFLLEFLEVGSLSLGRRVFHTNYRLLIIIVESRNHILPEKHSILCTLEADNSLISLNQRSSIKKIYYFGLIFLLQCYLMRLTLQLLYLLQQLIINL